MVTLRLYERIGTGRVELVDAGLMGNTDSDSGDSRVIRVRFGGDLGAMIT